MKRLTASTVEEFLETFRRLEPGIRRSVDLWARTTTMPIVEKSRKVFSPIAPDGKDWSAGAEEYKPQFKMAKPRGES